MNKKHILLVEDEEALAATLRLNLELENFKVTVAVSGNTALSEFTANYHSIDLVLLDVMLPEINGFDLCERFKKTDAQIPVIFLTAKNMSSEKITGLKLGAEDYITKPFELEELMLRIQNVLKRSTKPSTTNYTFDGGKINFETFEITDISGQTHEVSKREIGLLKLLTLNENKVISRDEILEKLWDESENASSRTIDNFILGFRKLFEKNPKEPKHFHSIRGVGYKFTK